jgi:hypothetical protein
LTPGSTKKFKELDEEFNQRQNETLEEMKEEREFRDFWETDEEGEEYFSAIPRYELSHEVYSLEDFIEEQVAESLTNKNKIAENGLEKYVKTTLIGLMNQIFETSHSQNDFEFQSVWRWKEVEKYFYSISQKVSSDIETVHNPKYKNLALKFNAAFQNWLSNLEKELEKTFDEDQEISLTDLINKLLSKTSQWIGTHFNVRELKNQIFNENKDKIEYEPNEFGEKEISKLTDDFKMSLARRWLLAVDKEVDHIISSLS